MSFLVAILLFLGSFFVTPVLADSCEGISDITQKIECLNDELGKLGSQKKTLASQISSFDAQIKLTTLKISQTEEKINLLSGRIDQLEGSLDLLTDAFSQRAVETYKLAKINDPFLMVLSSKDLKEAVSRFFYLKKIQQSDRDLLERLQNAQDTYKVEKVDQEELQNELEDQKSDLALQKASKSKLLEITKNDEKRYQNLLAQAKAELEAIQSILVGKGQEVESGSVGEGSRIASVIPGVSACSTGSHLHFEIVKDGKHHNPANYLSSKSVVWDNLPDSPFGFSGSWSWPINDPVRITQGYGMTYYAATLRYYGGSPHTGIDMINTSDLTVKAVKSGVLYKGAIACGGGTLRYVKVKQEDGYDVYYLHVNY